MRNGEKGLNRRLTALFTVFAGTAGHGWIIAWNPAGGLMVFAGTAGGTVRGNFVQNAE